MCIRRLGGERGGDGTVRAEDINYVLGSCNITWDVRNKDVVKAILAALHNKLGILCQWCGLEHVLD